MATYRGTPVASAAHNRGDDTYSLFDEFGDLIAVLERHEYLSQPQLRSMRLSNGRDRPTPAKDQRSSVRKPRDPWATAAGALSLSPGAINTLTNSNAGSGLTAAQFRQQADAMMQALTFAPPSLLMRSQYLKALRDVEGPKPPLKRDGIVAGEIVGYRCWRIEGGLVRSVYQKDVWRPGAVLEGRELGDWDARGIHAWKDPASKEYHDYIRGYLNSQDVFRIMMGRKDRDDRPAMVTGTIFMWGDVVEHERGWRAEYARVRSLDWLYPDETMMGREQAALDELRAKYVLTPR